ncbi:HbrB-like-domain-containing protein [Crepidotus variabilis]|uniref:HbrB-like-domain-containing protein n=1 Tax=Crepidotus variabilis TaxID=179855 RepID=A0A9P6EI29_9AGAR|nr:HbrB-like-domain-containing protein [Crepidotus variabilis]
MWSSAHLHGPRRSQDHNRYDSSSARSEDDDDGSESKRRTSSDATPRPTPATTRFLGAISGEKDTNRNVLTSNPTIERSEGLASSKRLGFFADKITSSLSATGKDLSAAASKSSLLPSQLLHPHSHSRADSNPTSPSSLSPSGLSVSSPMSSSTKPHTSPSKASYGRTYDPKHVQREMHRLGTLAHLPSALAPQLSSTPSGTSLSMPTQSGMSQSTSSLNSTTDPWGALHVHVLPLFNGEPLRIPIEDLNVLVKRHIQSVVSSAPSKALATLENDASELIAQGMVTLNAKLKGIEDEKLVARVVEIWGFFWDQVLTYLEGVLLPLQTDALLSSLYRNPKPQRATSPERPSLSKSTSSSMSSTSLYHIDVRSVALKSFRDRVILPPFQRLYTRLSILGRQNDGFQDTTSYQQPRLQQMLLVLSAQSRYLPATFSLTTPSPQPTAGEAAIRDLLRLVRNPRPQADFRNTKFKSPFTRTPTFLSGGLPRDRRGRVAGKGKSIPEFGVTRLEDEMFGEDTPRMGPPASYVIEIERERERELLEALRSPDVDPAAEANAGGWGLDVGNEDPNRTGEVSEYEDEPSDWEQAQANPRAF